MAKKSYHAPAIIEASQFERRTLLTGCAKANPACLGTKQSNVSTCQSQTEQVQQGGGSLNTLECQNRAFVS